MSVYTIFMSQKTRRGSRTMKCFNLFALLAVYFVCCIFLTEVHATTVAASSCSLAHVQAAVNAATRGDTVSVPAGSCTWNSYLSITKAITLQGTGAGSTTIKSNIKPGTYFSGTSGTWIITFVPSSIIDDKDEVFRITGFTFDLDHNANAIYIYNSSGTYSLNKVRIDNNTFTNCRSWANSNVSGNWDWTIMPHGNVYGVAHSNTFEGWVAIQPAGNRYGTGGATSFLNEPLVHGSAKAFYFEDNTINYTGTNEDQIFGTTWGASTTIRYNTITITGSQYKTLVDYHGNQPSGTLYGARGGEAYGNKIVRPAGGTTRIVDVAGGSVLNFYNSISTSGIGSNQVRETYIDHVSGYACPAGTLYPGNYCSSSGQTQHTSKTYMFNNRYGSARSAGTEITTASKVTGPKDSNGRYPVALRENYEYWLPNSSCRATGSCSWGIGCGESVPTGTCTTGTAYWVTSNSDSCSDLANLTGASHTSNISGTLYRCGPTNNWKAYYSPYTYPHPLRSGEAETISAPKGFKLVN